MAGRAVERSAAFAALSVGGRKVLKVIEEEVRRGAVALSLDDLMGESGLCRSAVRYGVKQAQLLGFIAISVGHRRVNQFALSDHWRELDEDEAKRLVAKARSPTPQRPRTVPPKPVKRARIEVEQPRPAASAVIANGGVAWWRAVAGAKLAVLSYGHGHRLRPTMPAVACVPATIRAALGP